MQSFDEEAVKIGAGVVLAAGSGLRKLYGPALGRAGYTVWEAGDGATALRLVRAHRPQLLLICVWMPVLNGLDVIEQLASLPEASAVKVVVISPSHESDTELECAALGVDGYWTTDLSADEFCKRIDEMILSARTPPR
jgi:two-component system chemotaxis response regulator CheY